MVGKPYSKMTVQSRETALSRGRAAMGRRMLEGPDYGFGPLLMGFSERSLFAKGCGLVSSERASEATPCAPSHNAPDSNLMRAQLYINLRQQMGYSSQKFPQRTQFALLFMCSELVQAGLASLLSY